MEPIQVMGVRGLPLIQAGDNIASLICENTPLHDGDVLCVASTIYSKSKGYTKPLLTITPSDRAVRLGNLNGEDPRFVQAVLDASSDIIMEHPFILSELSFGHIGVRAGVDQSNIEDGMVIFLPPDPMKAADDLREEIQTISSANNVGTIITDTCGRSFRRGQTGNAIGWSGGPANPGLPWRYGSVRSCAQDHGGGGRGRDRRVCQLRHGREQQWCPGGRLPQLPELDRSRQPVFYGTMRISQNAC